MTRLRDALKALKSQSNTRLNLREISLCTLASERISETGTAQPREGRDYNKIAQELLARINSGDTLSWREIRDGAWCLWRTSPALADCDESLTAVTDGVLRNPRKQPFRALASSYMVSFEKDLRGIVEVGRVLRLKASEMGRPWAALHAEHDIFHLTNGADNVANDALQQRTSPTEVLKHAGIGVLDAETGFAKECAAAVLRRLASGAEADPIRRLEIVQTLALRSTGGLMFPDHGPLIAEALIKPFGTAMPERATRDKFLALLIALFGDPRRYPGRWSRMREIEIVIRRWLTEQTLRQFLDVVDEVALEHMWKYRRAFWEAVYARELIDEAWVVFDPAGVKVARRTFGKQADFAQFEDTVLSGHAVLLMRVGRGLVVEWSHSGRCIIWNDAEARGAPRLNQSLYAVRTLRAPASARDDITSQVFAVTHQGSDRYAWQQKVSNKIHQMTGVRIPQSSYTAR